MITFLDLPALTCLLCITNSVSHLSNQKLTRRIQHAERLKVTHAGRDKFVRIDGNGGDESHDQEKTNKNTQVRLSEKRISSLFVLKIRDDEKERTDRPATSIFQSVFQTSMQPSPTPSVIPSEVPSPMTRENIFNLNMGGNHETSDIKRPTSTSYSRTRINAPPDDEFFISDVITTQNYEEEEQDPNSFTLIPMLFTSLTTAILFCSIFLVCVKRCDRKAMAKLDVEQQIINEHLNDDGSTQNSGDLQEWHSEDNHDRNSINGQNKGDDHSDSRDHGKSQNHGNWTHAMMQELANYNPYNDEHFTNILPPMMQSDEEETRDMYDEFSTSHVSTLSGSDVDGSICYPDYEEIQPRIVSQQDHDLRVTTRIEMEKIYNSKKLLSKTVKRLLKIASDSFEDADYSDWSSLTGGSTATSGNSALLGENCLKSEDRMETIVDLTDNANDKLVPLAYGEHPAGNRLNASKVHQDPEYIPTLDIEANSSNFILLQDDEKVCFCAKPCVERDVFFPVTSPEDFGVLGIEIQDPPNEYGHPKVSYVNPNGKLCERILSGDTIVRVNNKKMCGATAVEVLKYMFEKVKDDTEELSIVHLTLIGSKPQRILDGKFGMLEGREEI